MKLLWEKIVVENELDELGSQIALELESVQRFCLWLEGPLGAGKTSLVRHILYALGLPRYIPVPSPTYSLINEYVIEDRLYAHLDLYRIEGNFDEEDLGLVSEREVCGLFVEWPDKLHSEQLLPSHKLSIRKQGDNLTQRTYLLYSTHSSKVC